MPIMTPKTTLLYLAIILFFWTIAIPALHALPRSRTIQTSPISVTPPPVAISTKPVKGRLEHEYARGQADAIPPPLPAYPEWRGPRCANTTKHHYNTTQYWTTMKDLQITPDCFAYGIDTYVGQVACGLRNLCFGNCSRTYEECIHEWVQDPTTNAARRITFADQMWETLPLEQYFKFSNMSCKCVELRKCAHLDVNCKPWTENRTAPGANGTVTTMLPM